MYRWLMEIVDSFAKGFGWRLGSEAAEEVSHEVGDKLRELL